MVWLYVIIWHGCSSPSYPLNAERSWQLENVWIDTRMIIIHSLLIQIIHMLSETFQILVLKYSHAESWSRKKTLVNFFVLSAVQKSSLIASGWIFINSRWKYWSIAPSFDSKSEIRSQVAYWLASWCPPAWVLESSNPSLLCTWYYWLGLVCIRH